MSLIAAQAGPSELEGILSHRPELLEKYREFYLGFWKDGLVPRRVLEICRRRIAWIQGCEAELSITDAEVQLSDAQELALQQGRVDAFDAPEQAALALAELIPHGVHNITDDMVAAASSEFGHPGCVALLTALSFMDVNCRLKLVLDTPVRNAELSADLLG